MLSSANVATVICRVKCIANCTASECQWMWMWRRALVETFHPVNIGSWVNLDYSKQQVFSVELYPYECMMPVVRIRVDDGCNHIRYLTV